MQPLSTRTEHFTDSVIRRMTRVSAKYGAINLSQGYPDFNPPSAILDRLAEVLRAPGDGILVEVFVRYFGQAVQNRRRRVEIRVTLGKIDGTVLSADAGHAADNGIGKMSVSYTHLDVYKRQPPRSPLAMWSCMSANCAF